MRSRKSLLVGLASVSAVLAAACGSSPGSSSSPPTGVGGPTGSTSGVERITFAENGLGSEGQQTQNAIKAFEQANPNIQVTIEVLSPDSTTYLQQLQQAFIAGSSTPDVFESDVTYPPKFAQAGWAQDLSRFNPPEGAYFTAEAAAGRYHNGTYAIPWFDNPEGLFYRTDLVPSPPTSPSQIVSDARAAMRQDPSLKEGLAFEGAKYEGGITALLTVDSAFGGRLAPGSISTPGNDAALQWLHDAIYTDKIAPQAAVGWEEGQVQQEFTSGHAVFAIDYPFVESVAASSPVAGHVAYIPFPALSGGTPGSALGGEMLSINAKSRHSDAAWKLIQFLTSPQVEIARAEATGDPPSLPSAYTDALYAAAPYFRAVKVLNQYAQPRPITPDYLQLSVDLQNAISAVLADSESARTALSAAQAQAATRGT